MLAAAAAAANKNNGFSYGAAASHSTLSPRGGQPTVSASAAPAVYTINTAVAGMLNACQLVDRRDMAADSSVLLSPLQPLSVMR